MPLSTTVLPASATIASIMPGYLPSRSRIICLIRRPASSRSIARLRVAWLTQAEPGWAMASRMRTRRVACSMAARTFRRAPVTVTVVPTGDGDPGDALALMAVQAVLVIVKLKALKASYALALLASWTHTEKRYVPGGVELASGSIRNHRVDLQRKIFELMGYDRAAQDRKFGLLLSAIAVQLVVDGVRSLT